MSASGQNAEDMSTPLVTRLLIELKKRVFQLVFALSRADARISSDRSLALVGRAIVFLQLLSFPLSAEFELPWNNGYIGWLQDITTAFRFDRIVIGNDVHSSSPIWLTVMVCLAVAAWLGVAAWLSVKLNNEDESRAVRKYNSHLVIFRRVSEVMTTIMYIPILEALLVNARCGPDHDVQCGSGNHIIFTVVGAVFAVVFFAMTTAMVMLYANRHPGYMMRRHMEWMRRNNQQHEGAHIHSQSTWLSRPHTRVDFIMHVLVSVMVAAFCGSADLASGTRWMLVAIMLVVFATGALAHVFYMPYYKYDANVFHTTMWWVLLWASVGSLIVQAYEDDTLVVGPVLFFVCTPLVIGVAHFACLTRRHTMLTMRLEEMTHPVEVELHVRFVIQDAESALLAMHTEAKDLELSEDDEEMQQLLGVDEDALVAECQAWMEQGERKHSRDDVLLVTYARFLHFYINDQHKSQIMLANAAHRDPRVDSMFDIMMQRKETELSFRKTTAGNNMLSYMRYVDMLLQAENHTAEAYRAQYEFWSQMVESEPDQGVLLKLGDEVNEHVKVANEMYRESVKINNLSPLVTRRYAEFTSHLLNDEEEGKALMQRAQDLDRKRQIAVEERARGAGARVGTHGRLEDPTARIFDDDTSVISISGEPDSLGIILSANTTCCALFGRLQSEMAGNNVSMLMPPPFSEEHNSYMAHFHATGNGPVINQTRPIVGLHKNGHLFPFTLTVKEVLGMDTVVFVGIIEEVHLPRNEHLMLIENSTGKVIRTTPQCAPALGISTNELLGNPAGVTSSLPGFVLDGNGVKLVDDDDNDDSTSVPQQVELEINGYRVCFDVYHDKLKFASAAVGLLRIVETLRARADDDSDVFGGGAVAADGMAPLTPQHAALGMDNAFDESDADMDADSDDGMAGVLDAGAGADADADADASASATSPQVPAQRKEPQMLPLTLALPVSDVVDAAPGDMDGVEMAVMHEDSIRIRERDKDEGSVVSGASGASAASGFSSNSRSSMVMIRSAIERIRSQFLVRHNKMDRAIMGLRIAFFAMVLIIVIMAIVGQTVTENAITDYQSQVDKILKSGARRSYAVTLGYQTRTLDMVRRNVLPTTFTEPTYADMIQLATKLEHDNNDLALHDDKITKENRDLYQNPEQLIYELVGGEVQSRHVGLLQAITLVISHSRLVTETPVEEISTANEHVYYMIKNTNGIDGIVEAINKSTIYYEEATVEAADVVFELQLILLCISIGVMVVMLVMVFRPTINRVERVRTEVFDMFIDISVKDIEQLQGSALNMLDDDMVAQLGDMDDDDEHRHRRDDEADKDMNVIKGHDTDAVSVSNAGVHDDAGRRRRGADDKKKKGEEQKKLKHGIRKYKNEQRRFLILMAKVSVLLAIAGAFFAYAYVIETTALQGAVDRLPELNYAGRRRFFTRSSLVEYRECIMEPYTKNGLVPTDMVVQEQLVYRSVGFLRAIQQALMFGNSDYHLAGAIHRKTDRDELMYANACPYLTDMVPDCTTWNDGIMTHGLDAAVEDYLRRIVDGTYRIARDFDADTWTQQKANDTIRDPEQEVLREYDRIYLEAGLQVAASQHAVEERQKLEDMIAFRSMMMGIFLAASIVLYLVVYDPMIYRLDVELKGTRGMLLMIPEALIMATPSLRKLMNKAKF